MSSVQYGYDLKLLSAPAEAPSLRRSPPGPEPKYDAVSEVITQVWKAAEQLCGKRLVRALPLWLPHYERHYGKLLAGQKKLLSAVSAATLDRLLSQQKAERCKGLGGTKPGKLLRHHVPIQGKFGMNVGSVFWRPIALLTVAAVWPEISSGV